MIMYLQPISKILLSGGSHVDNNSSSNISDGFCDYMAGDNQTTIVGPGCNPEKQPWCCHQAKVYLFQYLTGLPIITIGFCASSILCQTIMSKILGPWPQVKACIVAVIVLALMCHYILVLHDMDFSYSMSCISEVMV